NENQACRSLDGAPNGWLLQYGSYFIDTKDDDCEPRCGNRRVYACKRNSLTNESVGRIDELWKDRKIKHRGLRIQDVYEPTLCQCRWRGNIYHRRPGL